MSVKRQNRKTAKAIVYSLLITQAVVQLILFIFFRNEDESTRIGYIFISFFFSFVGLLFGIMLCIMSNTGKNESGLYFAGPIIAFGWLLYLYLDGDSPEKIRAKRFENASDSYQYIYQDSDTLNVYLKPAQLAIAREGLSRSLNLQSDGQGHWNHGDGRAIEELNGCRDIDIWPTPFTNSFPIRREPMAIGERRQFLVAWVFALDLTFRAQSQAYTRLAERLYLFENLDGSGFQAELPVDEDGIVVDYPDLFTRVKMDHD